MRFLFVSLLRVPECFELRWRQIAQSRMDPFVYVDLLEKAVAYALWHPSDCGIPDYQFYQFPQFSRTTTDFHRLICYWKIIMNLGWKGIHL